MAIPFSTASAADIELKASHQWPGGKGDVRDEMVQMIARHMDEVSDAQLIALASQILEIPSDRKQVMLEAGTLSERFLMVYEDLYRHLDVNPEFESFNPDELN